MGSDIVSGVWLAKSVVHTDLWNLPISDDSHVFANRHYVPLVDTVTKLIPRSRRHGLIVVAITGVLVLIIVHLASTAVSIIVVAVAGVCNMVSKILCRDKIVYIHVHAV